MKLQYIILLLLITTSYFAKAQNDTLYFNAKWAETTKKNASFYRPPLQKAGAFYKMEDYYIDGTLQMSGTSRFKDSLHLEGKAVWFDQNGEISQQETYKNNILHGIATYHSEEPGRFSREITYDMGTVVQQVYFDKKLDGIRYIRYFENGNNVKNEFYGKGGEFIGSYNHSKAGQGTQTRVSYYHNPMIVQSIEVFEDGAQLYFHSFYRNGRKKIVLDAQKLTETTYDQEGKQIGIMQYRFTDGLRTYLTGKTYVFYYDNVIKSITTYKDSNQTKKEEFDINGTLIREEYFEKNQRVQVVSYSGEGEKIGVYKERNGNINGTIRTNNNAIITYKDNMVQKAAIPFRQSKSTFASLENSVLTFYDKKGEKLGSLTVKLEPGEFRIHQLETNCYPQMPIEGTLFEKNHNDQIIRKTVYKNAKKTSDTKYYYEQGKPFLQTDFYDENGDVTKKIKYFSNGEIQSITNYLQGGGSGRETTASFFDYTGKKISEFNYETDTGTLYEYFPHSDDIKYVVQMENQKFIMIKGYEKFYDHDLEKDTIVLREIIDFNGEAKFYSREGGLIAEATFKNGEPTGTIYFLDNNELVEVKNGKRHGKHITYEHDEKTIKDEGHYKNGKKHGTFRYFNQGVKQKEINYKEGQKEGYTVYYDRKGNETSRLMYKNNEPYEGISHESNYNNTNVYKEGEIVKRTRERQKFDIITTFPSEKVENTLVLNKKGKKLISYTQRDNQLHGKLTYYKDNTPDQIAMFEDGKLIEGAVWLDSNSRFRKEAYARLSRENNKVTFETYNEKGELAFNGSVIIDFYEDYNERIVQYRLGSDLQVSVQHLYLKEYGVVVF